MKILKNIVPAFLALLATTAFVACNDANEYEDTNTDPYSAVTNYNDSLTIAHPETLSGTTWQRTNGINVNVYGENVQGYIESVQFIDDTYCVVTMSEPEDIPSSISNSATWLDETTTEDAPYEYAYSNVTGSVDIYSYVEDSKGNKSRTNIISGVAVNGNQTILSLSHFGDVPQTSYLTLAE